MSLLLDESNTSLNQILRMSLTHSSANLMQDGRSCMTRSLGMTHPRKLWTPPCFLPVSLERAPARHGRCRTGAFHVIVFRMRVTELPKSDVSIFRVEHRNQDDNFQQHSSTQHNTEAIGCEPHPDGCRPNHLSSTLISNFVDFTLLGCGDCLVPVAGVEPARISIHSPHARGDPPLPRLRRRAHHFNPLPSCEGRRTILRDFLRP